MQNRKIDLTGIPESVRNPRAQIQDMIQRQDESGLLAKAAELHGHVCDHVTLGVRAGCLSVRRLGEQTTDGMEEITCIVECNNCFSDGVQITTGCTFGNNALIFRDLGKDAFTLIKRGGKAIRVSVRAEAMDKIFALQEKVYPGTAQLFDKVITRRSGSPEESELLKAVFLKGSFELLSIPREELFLVKEVQAKAEDYAPIFQSYTCNLCGDKIMQSRARVYNGQTVCISCAKDSFFQLDGSGISQRTTTE
jgi:formylmethanofuran dehydrogenase subunit E